MADIFISYASEDRSRAEPLAKTLEDQGWSVWWDPQIPPGKTFFGVIKEALEAAKCVVVLWSKQSINSDWVLEEANFGKRHGILVPAKIDSVDPPLGFGLIQAADLTDWETETSHAGLSSLLSAISEFVGPSLKKFKEAEQLRAEEERRRRQEQEQRLREKEQKRVEAARKAEDKRKQKETEAKRKAEEDMRRKEKEEQERKADEEKRRKEQELKQKAEEERLKKEAEAKRSAEQARKDKEIEEQRKIEEERKRKEEEQKRIETARKAEKERTQKEAAAKRKADEEKQSREVKAKTKPDKPEPAKDGQKGKIIVGTLPKNATIKILNIDQSFQQGMALESGNYQLEVSAEDYKTQKKSINISPGEETRINVRLIEQRSVPFFVKVVPEYAEVKILNIKNKFSQGMELEPSRYDVEVKADKYETQRRWVNLKTGHNEPFIFELARIETPGPSSPKNIITNSIDMKLVLMSEGQFIRECPLEWSPKNRKKYEILISMPFYLQTTEVSQAQWKKVMRENPSCFKDCSENCPVEQVSWHDVQKFIEKLNQIEGINKYRLPTEAEWEYACRAKTDTEYYFGDDVSKLGEVAWYKENSQNQTHPVGKKKPNAWGLYDMHGNVWEWCQDWYGVYPSRSVADPKGPDEGLQRVLRGGSWGCNANKLCSDNRFGLRPSRRSGDIGFRVARDF